MKRRNLSFPLQLFVILLIALLVMAGGAGTALASGGSWKIVPGANLDVDDNNLAGVAAVSARNVWAVGYYQGSGPRRTLIERWNGSRWSVVPSPNVDQSYNTLGGVSVISANDVWAVGMHYPDTLIEHWNGKQWSVVPSPAVKSSTNDRSLYAVAGVSKNDVWVVGYDRDGTSVRTLVEHWNGRQWSIVPSPNVGSGYNFLTAISALTEKNVWAVGYYFSNDGNTSRALIEHWNGKRWSVVSHPNPGTSYNILSGVTALSANDVWVVGCSASGSDQVQNLVEHWNGKQWRVVPSPEVGINSAFTGIVALSVRDIWAIGRYDRQSMPTSALIQHWDGHAWSIVANPSTGTHVSNMLAGIARVPGTNQLWAVGVQARDSWLYPSRTFTMFKGM